VLEISHEITDALMYVLRKNLKRGTKSTEETSFVKS
jgi:hypothetical protein